MKFSKVSICLLLTLASWGSPHALSQQLPVVDWNGQKVYAPDKPFFGLTCVGPVCPSGGSGFPISLGTTPIGSGGAVGEIDGLIVNGVTLQHGGSTSAFLNQAGGYSGAGGASVNIKYMSVAGCPQDSDGNAGGGTLSDSCINALFSASTPSNPVTVWQDRGFSLIKALRCPAGGNCTLTGNGAGIARTYITNCSISGGVAILTTLPNTLAPGDVGTLANLSNCHSISNTTVTVLSSGLTSTQFEVAASGSTASGAENASFNQLYGTGFYVETGANDDAIANGEFLSGGSCVVPAGAPASQGANIHLSNIAINGNANGQSNYCFAVHIKDLTNFSSEGVVYYNASHYSLTLDNVSNSIVENNTFFSSSDPTGTNTDGIHVDGPGAGLRIIGNYFKTGDDAIALNSIEGDCGPISSVQISNNYFDQAANALRMYNENQNACANSLVPLISYVDWNNNNGTVVGGLILLGLDGFEAGTLNPAISHVHFSNSTFNGPSSSVRPFRIEDNTSDLTISNFTVASPQNAQLIQFGYGNCLYGTGYYNKISLSNFTVSNTPTGSAFENLYAESACVVVGTLSVDGFGTTFDGISGFGQGPLAPPLTSGSTINQLLLTNVDPTDLSLFSGGDAMSTWGINNIFAMTPNGLVTTTIVGAAPSIGPTYQGAGLPWFTVPDSTLSNCNFNGFITSYVFGCAPTSLGGHTVYFPLAYPNP